MRHAEHHEQKALFTWAAYAKAEHPELDLMFAIPNGGNRSAITGAILKAEGVRAGSPDVVLPVPRIADGRVYGALYIELKVKGGRPSPAQRDRLQALSMAGNYCAICYGFDEAQACVLRYLALERPQVVRVAA